MIYRCKYTIVDWEKRALLSTSVLEEIKDCEPEYDNVNDLIRDLKEELDTFKEENWSAYIKYLEDWASTHKGQEHFGLSPDDYDAFYEERIRKEKKNEQD